MGLDHVQQAFNQGLLDIRRGGRLSTRLAGEFAAKIAVGVAEPLYAQIDPNRLGEMQRAMRIAHEYGLRLDRYTRNLRPGALDKLVAGYPSHSFVIDRKEATELFNNVVHPTKAEADFCNEIWHILGSQSDKGPFVVDENEFQEKGHDGNGEVSDARQGNADGSPAPEGELGESAGEDADGRCG